MHKRLRNKARFALVERFKILLEIVTARFVCVRWYSDVVIERTLLVTVSGE
jgi:hypothetical protein